MRRRSIWRSVAFAVVLYAVISVSLVYIYQEYAWPVVNIAILVMCVVIYAVVEEIPYLKRKRKLATAKLSLGIGDVGMVIRDGRPRGKIRIGGEVWDARTRDNSPLDKGEAVRVVGDEGIVLIVEAADRQPGQASPTEEKAAWTR